MKLYDGRGVGLYVGPGEGLYDGPGVALYVDKPGIVGFDDGPGVVLYVDGLGGLRGRLSLGSSPFLPFPELILPLALRLPFTPVTDLMYVRISFCWAI